MRKACVIKIYFLVFKHALTKRLRSVWLTFFWPISTAVSTRKSSLLRYRSAFTSSFMLEYLGWHMQSQLLLYTACYVDVCLGMCTNRSIDLREIRRRQTNTVTTSLSLTACKLQMTYGLG